jgi:hypothetical protein
MTCSVPPLVGDVGAESHDLLSKSQQGGWLAQQHAATRVLIRAAVFHLVLAFCVPWRYPQAKGSLNQGQPLCVFSFSMEYCYLQPCLFRI